jgi:aspartyl-tRNA synthetase
MQVYERTAGCGHIGKEYLGKSISLSGWVNKRRDHGNVIFIDLRDVSGFMQLVFSPEIAATAHKLAEQLRSEFVISIRGTLVKRAESQINEQLSTGQFEVQVSDLTILNRAKVLPFQLDEANCVDEELRLEYRYLDMRRPEMFHRLALRHHVVRLIREYFYESHFFEFETPILTKNTAEGAREFLVPSRLHQGSFYALPQSPQLYKQLLMCGGTERYFQIARCFRDEDLRADRQPEFTQLDVEMSFITELNIQNLIEGLLQKIFTAVLERPLDLPLQRMTYAHAFETYGSDKPDLRFDLPLYDISSLFASTELAFIKGILDKGGKVGALHISEYPFTRSELEHWVSQAIKNGAKGLVWIRFKEDGSLEAPIAKFLPADFLARAQAVIPSLKAGSTLFLVAGPYKESWSHLGKLRLQIAEALKLVDHTLIRLLWITDFPLLEYDEASKQWTSVHHPFTSPQPGWETQEPAHMKARAYDIVFNGVELGGGSIRIHDPEIQKKVFNFLGLKKEEMESHFGFLFEAQELGFPPHGGIALGIDRFVMLLVQLLGFECKSIREVIAFPKTQSGYDPLMHAPTPVDPKKLADYALKVILENKG